MTTTMQRELHVESLRRAREWLLFVVKMSFSERREKNNLFTRFIDYLEFRDRAIR